MKKFIGFSGIGVMAFFIFSFCHASGFFIDVSPDHQNFIAITSLRDQGVINGYADGTFQPDKEINRAEMLKLLLVGAGMETSVPIDNPFPDVRRDQWFAPFVAKGKLLNIVKGTGSGKFEPERTINRAEALKMILLTNGIELSEVLKNPYLDVDQHSWYAVYFAFAKDNNLFDHPEYANPGAKLTRGEMAELCYRIEKWKENKPVDVGIASFYATPFEKENSSDSGPKAYSAAHQTLPFDTIVLVTNVDNQKSVIVKINDRGPFVENRIIDLSKTAFTEIADLGGGLAKVEITVLPPSVIPGKVTKEKCGYNIDNQIISKDAFAGLTLDQDLPAIFRRNEVVEISGTLNDEIMAETVSVFFKENDYKYIGKVYGRKFIVSVVFNQTGKLSLGIIPGESGSSIMKTIDVYDNICDPNFDIQAQEGPKNLDITITDNVVQFIWEDNSNNFFQVRLSQGANNIDFYVNNRKRFFVSPILLKDFSQGLAKLEISGALIENDFSSSQSQRFKKGIEKEIFLVTHYNKFLDENIINLRLAEIGNLNGNVQISGRSSAPLLKQATLILPNGQIIDTPLTISEAGDFNFIFNINHIGTHIVEINKTDGSALINVPIYQKGFVPILPDFWDANPNRSSQKLDLHTDRNLLLLLINANRKSSGLSELILDDKISSLAQFRAEDMRDRNYYSHINPDGKKVNDYRIDHAIDTLVAENFGRDINVRSVHEGLWRSPIHRKAILGEKYDKIGIGIAQRSDGEVIIVELFSEPSFMMNSIEEYRMQILTNLNVKRSKLLVPHITLDAVAQNWSDKMNDQGFFGFEDDQGDSLENILQNAGITKETSAFLYQYSPGVLSFMQSILEHENIDMILDNKWINLGIGITADEIGNLTAVIIVSG